MAKRTRKKNQPEVIQDTLKEAIVPEAQPPTEEEVAAPPPAATFQVSQEVREAPRRVRLASGAWVGLGGEIRTQAVPPRIPRIYREATAEEYAGELAERFPKYVTKT